MGDLNAKMGSDPTWHEDVMGETNLGNYLDNGERFVSLLTVHCSDRPYHKVIWFLNGRLRTHNRIDQSRLRVNFSDMRNKRGADFSLE